MDNIAQKLSLIRNHYIDEVIGKDIFRNVTSIQQNKQKRVRFGLNSRPMAPSAQPSFHQR